MTDRTRENAEIARRIWRAASEGDPEPMLELHPKMFWRTTGTSIHAGELHGVEAVLRYLAHWSDGVEDLQSDLIDVLASQRGAVLRYRMRAVRGTRRLDLEYSLWLEIEDGVVHAATLVPFEQAVAEAFYRLD